MDVQKKHAEIFYILCPSSKEAVNSKTIIQYYWKRKKTPNYKLTKQIA